MPTVRLIAGLVVAVAISAMPVVPQQEQPFHGVWNPVVGAGAVYEMTHPHGKSEIQIAVVGKEAVNGNDGYWMELKMNSTSGLMYTKSLVTMEGKKATLSRTITQSAGRPPMEVNAKSEMSSTDVRDISKLVGTETVTTPAGSFRCEHYRTNDGKLDLWISDKVSPWGLVKSKGSEAKMEAEMVVTRLVTGVRSQITGPPQTLGPGRMSPQAGQPPR